MMMLPDKTNQHDHLTHSITIPHSKNQHFFSVVILLYINIATDYLYVPGT